MLLTYYVRRIFRESAKLSSLNIVVINDTDLVDVLFKWRDSECIRFSNILGLRAI